MIKLKDHYLTNNANKKYLLFILFQHDIFRGAQGKTWGKSSPTPEPDLFHLSILFL